MVCCNASSQNGWSLTHGEPEVHLFCGPAFCCGFYIPSLPKFYKYVVERCFKPLKAEPQAQDIWKTMVLEWSLTQEWKVILHRNPNKLPKISGHFWEKATPNSWLVRLLWSFRTFKAGIKNGGSTSYLVLGPDQPSSESLKTPPLKVKLDHF